jgi:ssDNA-binding replication factor A large subunit
MSSNNASGKVVTVDEQAFEKAGGQAVDEDGFPVVDETPAFEAAVEQETQAKVDANHPDGIADTSNERIHGVTLEQEERIRAREAELERISAQAELGTQDGRAKRTREVVTERRQRKREERTPERTDPRERLSRMELSKVNQEADRMAQRLRTGHSRAAVSRALAKRVAKGQDITEAVFDTMDALKAAPGAICPIEDVPDVQTDEVSIEGTVIELWAPSDPAIAQVGLIADDTDKIKWTSWKASEPAFVQEGERVRMRHLKKNWYQGRCSLAVTYDSMIVFPDRDDRWWEE